MGDAWANGIGGYEVASRRYHRAPEVGEDGHPTPERSESVKRLRGSVADRLRGMEPPEAQPVQPGGATHVRRKRPAQDARVAGQRPRVDVPSHGPSILDEILLDELEQKYRVQSSTFVVSTTTWSQAMMNYYPSTSGTDVSTRVGNSFIARRLCVRGLLYYDTAATSDTLYCRVVLLRDGKTTTGDMATPNTQSGAFLGDGSLWIHDHYNPSTVGDDKRYQILVDRVFNEQKISNVIRRGFQFCVDLDDEVITYNPATTCNMPAYILAATCNGPVQPTLYWCANLVYVDP